MATLQAVVGILFTMLAWSMVANALEPEIDRVLDSLGKNAICPPEFQNEGVEVCLNGNGDVILSGYVKEGFSLETDSQDYFYIASGNYDSSIIGKLDNLKKVNKIIINGKGTQAVMLNSLQLVKYSKEIAYLRKPIKQGFFLWKKIKYIPI